MEVLFEKKDICSKCKGVCCKKSGCDYSASDFEHLNTNFLYEKLKEGKISIVSYQDFKQIKGKITSTSFLYLRARNKNRDIVDLLSLKTTCLLLKENGCSYSKDERPSGGLNLIPSEDGLCYPYRDPMEIVQSWEPYQTTLAKLVKRITGNNVYNQIKKDAITFFYDIINFNFQDVSQTEISDVLNSLYLYKQAYPEEFNQAARQTSTTKKKKL